VASLDWSMIHQKLGRAMMVDTYLQLAWQNFLAGSLADATRGFGVEPEQPLACPQAR